MIVATFGAEASLSHALGRLREAGIGPLETYTPAPLQDASTASPIPLVILAAGVLGAIGSFWLQAWSSSVAYRFDIGGRPHVAWASFVPSVWENAALVAIVAGFAAFMAINRLPRLYHPVDEAAGMRRASRDRWVVQVASDEPAMLDRAHAVFVRLDPILVEDLPG